MRIDDPYGIRSTTRVQRRDVKRTGSTAAFDSLLDSASSGGGDVEGLGSVAPLDSLLALQEVDADEGNNRSQGLVRAESMLDALDRLRTALLTGELDPDVVDRLYTSAVARKAHVFDPRLREVLEDIELRAAVELAKLGRL